MLLTTTLVTFLTTLATALPTTTPSTPHHHRQEQEQQPTCTHIHPPLTPRLTLLNRPDLGLFSTQTLTFTLPAPAPGTNPDNTPTPIPGPCTLRAVFPANWEVIDTSLQAGGAPLAVNVYAVDGPAAGALVGTVRFAGVAGDGSAGRERVVVVNSFACRERMGYRLELAGVGEVGFVNGFDAGLGVEGGLEMAVGC